MVGEIEICPFCKKEVEPNSILCPNCKMNLRMIKQKAREVEDDWNIGYSTFKGIIKEPDTISEELTRISNERIPRIFERRKKFVENIMNQFPEVKRKLVDDHGIIFSAYIIEIPHENEEAKFDITLQNTTKQTLTYQTSTENFYTCSMVIAEERGIRFLWEKPLRQRIMCCAILSMRTINAPW